ncbi:MAG: DNA primase TraC [Candidatus Accumulibacter phosphatis]|uniref:DNA primase TraC n=1 Tax=Candidatus Accumulibacter phosphatis TaxID=327160 RepID=A0A080LT75_9PROT|nr:MAG: DNA primase TraC [Candidatus Accumulibacter phosphatis]HRF12125.1 phage/plasmid primase, P4 family [Candidatus Accumulibacter phosphatis]
MSRANTIFCLTLQEAFERAGMSYPNKDMAPGSLTRFSTDDGKADLAGFCKVFPDGVGAVFGCNRAGSKFTWQMRDTNAPKPTNEELQAARLKSHQARQQSDAARTKQHASAASTAARIFGEASEPDPERGYIKLKGITPYGARQDLDGSVVLAVRDPAGEIQSLQFIGMDGGKRFLPKAKMKGGRMIIGELENGKLIAIVEGWATACSIHEATGGAVVVGFSGSNLAVVAADLRRKFPDSPLLIAGDLDAHGKGLEYAQAAAATGAPAVVVLPKFLDGRAKGDWNDLHQAEGLDVVRRQLNVTTETPPWEVVPFLAPALAKTDARDGTATTRPLTELGNAHRLHDDHGENLKYVPEVEAWLRWDGKFWQWDLDGAAVRSMAAQLHRTIYAEGLGYPNDAEHFAKWARKSSEQKTIRAAVALLSDFEQVRLPMAHVDADEFLVGVDHARQVIDLRTGTARAATAANFVTKSLSCGFVGNASRAARWRQFLLEVFDGDQELIDWLQKFCGYLLTGSTQEHIFLFLYGHGANGKSVFIEVLKHVMGDYGRAIASETLSESKRNAGSASPDLADLVGARLVLCAETEDNAALAESVVKGLVSGDSMSARKLYAAPFQFRPVLKLIMAGNHKPIIRGNDHGIWRRVRLVPFNRTFTENERDPKLLAKLKAESSHILAWMVDGCVAWQRQGLADTPAKVREATDAYQVDQDLTGAWLSECTERCPHGETVNRDLYANYRAWSVDNGHRPASSAVLGRRLSERGYRPRVSNGKTLWGGLSLTDSRHHTPAGKVAIDGANQRQSLAGSGASGASGAFS